MSKLYEAISRLDEIASQEERNQEVTEIPFQQVKTRSNSFILRLAIPFAFLILSGLMSIGITAWWQDWFGLAQEMPVSFIATSESSKKSQRVIAPNQEESIKPGMIEMVSADFAKTPTGSDLNVPGRRDSMERPMDLSMKFEKPRQATLSDAKNLAEVSALSERDLDPRISIQPLVVVANTPDVIVEPQPLMLPEETDISTTDQLLTETAELSRWLQQAEQHRRSGDWEGAVMLFAKVWQKSKNPAVANNLAASLIELDRWQEASEILTIALSKEPEDQDLKQNLALVQRLMHQ